MKYIIIKKKSVVVGDAHIVPEGEEIPWELVETETGPMLVADILWMPYESYEKMRDFILSREDEILQDVENFGSLFSVLQWVNRMEHEVRGLATTARLEE